MARIAPLVIDWKPDRTSNVPVTEQIVDYMCHQVSSGVWPIGARLPSQRAMAEGFGVNRSTVIAAITELADYGIVEGLHGAGTRIVSNTWSLMLPGAPDWADYVSSGFFEANNATIQTINRMEFAPNIARLGTGELDPRLFPRDMWKQVLTEAAQEIDSLGYPPPAGMTVLREAIAAHMCRSGVNCTPAQVLITSGALQALQLISVSLLSAGSTVFAEAPSYIKSLQVFQSAGMRLSGVTMTNQHRHDLIDCCVANRLPIIEDNAYQDLYFGDEMPKPLKTMDETGMVITLGSASKSLAPGLRIGWIIANEPIVQRLADVKMQMDYGASLLSQWAFARFLTSGLYDRYLVDLKRELHRRRDAAMESLERHFLGRAHWSRPDGGFYVWLTFEQPVRTSRLFQAALKRGVLLNPGDIYDFEGDNSLRLSYAYTTPEEFEASVDVLAQVVREVL